jgi:hypothetical protein
VDSDRCNKVIFSSKAYLSVVAETYGRVETETGGILLGHRVGDVWYVLETLDPGPNSIFRSSYFEYDTPYVNHLANKVARFYKKRLELLGLWHRHPGSLDSFSATDDGTNSKYALETGFGAISGLVNLDPHLRLTMYFVSIASRYESRNLKYKKVPVDIGDGLIPTELLALKTLEDFTQRTQPRLRDKKSSTLQPMNVRSTERSKKVSSPGLLSTLFGSVGKLARRFTVKAKDAVHEPETTPTLEAPPPSGAQELVLDMLDSEMEYLESQTEYDYAVSMTSENEITVIMNYTQNMSAYPREVECVLVSDRKQQYAVLDGNQRIYEPGVIKEHINRIIRMASE